MAEHRSLDGHGSRANNRLTSKPKQKTGGNPGTGIPAIFIPSHNTYQKSHGKRKTTIKTETTHSKNQPQKTSKTDHHNHTAARQTKTTSKTTEKTSNKKTSTRQPKEQPTKEDHTDKTTSRKTSKTTAQDRKKPKKNHRKDKQDRLPQPHSSTTDKNHQQKTKTTAEDVNQRFTDILHHEWCFAA